MLASGQILVNNSTNLCLKTTWQSYPLDSDIYAYSYEIFRLMSAEMKRNKRVQTFHFSLSYYYTRECDFNCDLQSSTALV